MTSEKPPQSGTPVSQLSGLQQDAVASFVLRDFRRREELNKQAAGYAGYEAAKIVPFAAIIGLMYWHPEGWSLVAGAFFIALCLIQFHAIGINRRIDALMKLGAGNQDDGTKPPVDPAAWKD
jgi:hypothetical protein